MSPLRWTCKSLRQLARDLQAMGHQISHTVVGALLKSLKFSLQANRKTREGADHPDRDAQFAHINQAVTAAMAERQPVVSVDTKKKELVGEFKNQGREWRPKGNPEEVRVHDFVIKELGRAIPYGVYDIAANTGWVGVGIDNDTATFAVRTIRRWWREIGSSRYPNAWKLVIWASWIVARLGGWTGCASEKPPGPITMRHGLNSFHQRCPDPNMLAQALQEARDV